MIERPHIPESKLISTLRDEFGIATAQVIFLPIGNDPTASAFKVVDTSGAEYFLKLKTGKINEGSITIPSFINTSGLTKVVATHPTIFQKPYASIEGFSLLLYRFIQGGTAMQAGLASDQWIELGAILKQIHSTSLPEHLLVQIRKETFIPDWAKFVRSLLARIDIYDIYDGHKLIEFWQSKAAEIRKLVTRTDELGRYCQGNSYRFVPCHADFHTANVLISPDGILHIVDWDDVCLAPKERDLMFIDQEHQSQFFRGYGETDVDPTVISYYRYEWVIQEIGDLGERIFLRPELNEDARQNAVEDFIKLFEPGDVVEAAYAADKQPINHDATRK